VVGELIRNRIDAPGTSEQAWQDWSELGQLPIADVSGWSSAVIVAAHPDDEVLGAGGTIALLAAAGVRLRIILATDGEASHPGISDRAGLARRRVCESLAALGALEADAAEVIRLGLPDTGLQAREDDLTDALAEFCGGFDVCLAPWEKDAHADHEAAGRAARRAGGQVLTYPVWMWHWAAPDDERVPWDRGRRVPLPSGAAAAKRSAIQAFASQLTGPPDGEPVLPAGIVAHFTRAQEVFFQ
jgi:LmbE family N-acetylglucosaminyl deacetylase